MKKISIIIPCYNVEKYIRKCLDSIVNQTIGIENLQVILVDDASTDKTTRILHEYEKMYPESILIIECAENGKQGTARNIGMRYAEADYIGFVDGDDWVDLTMYEKLYAKAIEHDCDMVYCNAWWVQGNKKGMDYAEFSDGFIEITDIEDVKRFTLLGVCPFSIVIKIYKKSIIFENEIFFPEKLAYEDSYWSPIVNYFVKRVGSVGECLYFWRQDNLSTTRTLNKSHHLNVLIVVLMKINYFKEKGLFDTYKDELEYDFIYTFFIGGLETLFLTLKDIPAEVFIEMRKTLLSMFPSYKNNPYLSRITGLSRILLDIASIDIGVNDGRELNEIAVMYKKKYNEAMLDKINKTSKATGN